MEDTKPAKSRVTLLQKACALWHGLDDFIEGTGEPAGMEEVVEFAAQHMGFSDHIAPTSSNDSPSMENRVAYCGQECAHHAALMSPAIWSGLPEELMQRVFARLPLPGICRLQCLSKQWNRILNSHDFKQVCADAYPQMFAIIPGAYVSFGIFKVRLYDLKSNTWHAMEIDTGYPEQFHTMNASDGGLVCFACTSRKEKSTHVPILVCNPLTRAVRALPLHSHSKRPPKMLQLVMDRIRKCYQVLIVSIDRNGGRVAELFHSNTGAWTTTNLSDLKYFSGYRYGLNYDSEGRCYPDRDDTPCVYDYAEGHFLEIPVDAVQLGHMRPDGVIKCTLVQDRLFVLREKERKAIEGRGFSKLEYYIAEFQFLESGLNWLKLKDHRCRNLGPYPGFSDFDLPSVLACKGFLLVDEQKIFPPDEHVEYGLEGLYDLSTGKWHVLSQGIEQISSQDLMCELQWDAVP